MRGMAAGSDLPVTPSTPPKARESQAAPASADVTDGILAEAVASHRSIVKSLVILHGLLLAAAAIQAWNYSSAAYTSSTMTARITAELWIALTLASAIPFAAIVRLSRMAKSPAATAPGRGAALILRFGSYWSSLGIAVALVVGLEALTLAFLALSKAE